MKFKVSQHRIEFIYTLKKKKERKKREKQNITPCSGINSTSSARKLNPELKSFESARKKKCVEMGVPEKAETPRDRGILSGYRSTRDLQNASLDRLFQKENCVSYPIECVVNDYQS